MRIDDLLECYNTIKFPMRRAASVGYVFPFLFVFCTACGNNKAVEIPERVECIPDSVYPIYAEGVIDMCYCEQDSTYFVEYNKDSIPGTKYASQTVSCYTDPGSIVVFCSMEDVNEFIAWFADMQHNDASFKECDLFYIQRFVADSSYYYELVKK